MTANWYDFRSYENVYCLHLPKILVLKYRSFSFGFDFFGRGHFPNDRTLLQLKLATTTTNLQLCVSVIPWSYKHGKYFVK